MNNQPLGTNRLRKDLIIIGAGGSGKQVAEAVEDMVDQWKLLGYLDDDPLKQNKQINGIPVLGRIDDADKYPDCYFVIILGNPQNPFVKKKVVERQKIGIENYATIIHYTARVSKYAIIGRNTVIMPLCSIMSNLHIGNHVYFEGSNFHWS